MCVCVVAVLSHVYNFRFRANPRIPCGKSNSSWCTSKRLTSKTHTHIYVCTCTWVTTHTCTYIESNNKYIHTLTVNSHTQNGSPKQKSPLCLAISLKAIKNCLLQQELVGSVRNWISTGFKPLPAAMQHRKYTFSALAVQV